MDNKEEILDEIEKRVAEKKQLEGGSTVLVDINKSIMKYSDLRLREQDFAFRYAMEHRTYQQWANHYGVSYRTIHDMMHNPRVKELISEIQFDIRKYAVGMKMYLLREAMQQYARIFAVSEKGPNGAIDPEILSVKERAADKVMKQLSLGERPSKDDDKKEVNINIFGGQPQTERQERVVNEFGPDEKVTIEDVEEEVEKLRKTTALRKQIERYAGEETSE